jgi:hypothetical protein
LHHLECVMGDFTHLDVGMDPFHVYSQLKFH